MALQEIKSTALELVADGNLGKALHLVGDFLKSGFFHDDYQKFVSISGDYFSTIHQKINGTIDGEEFLKKEGLIRSRFIDFLDFLRDESEFISSSPNLPVPEPEDSEVLRVMGRLSVVFSSLVSKQDELEKKIKEFDAASTFEKMTHLMNEMGKLRIDIERYKKDYHELYIAFSRLQNSFDEDEEKIDFKDQITDFQDEMRYRVSNLEFSSDEIQKQLIDIKTQVDLIEHTLNSFDSKMAFLLDLITHPKPESSKVKFLRLLGFNMPHKNPE